MTFGLSNVKFDLNILKTYLVQYIRKQVITSRILHSAKIGLASMQERGTKGNDGKSLSYSLDSLLRETPVILVTQFHHQPVVGEVGDIVAGLPDGHLNAGLYSTVELKPSLAGGGAGNPVVVLDPSHLPELYHALT